MFASGYDRNKTLGSRPVAELAFTSAIELARLVREREVSPVELVETYLGRIDKLDDQLNAFVTVDGDRALQTAEAATKAVGSGEELPPFHGVPIPIKDLTPTAGLKTTFSSRAYADHVPDQDAASVRRLREAGFIVLGKTNAPEFGTFPDTQSVLNGVCHNPWDLSRNPGGSSGGAAVSVASGMAPVAHGSDGGGSIRIPASCCGLFGIKPARGRISHGPHSGEGWAGFSTDGPITRSVADAAALLDAMSGYEPGDPYWAPAPGRPFVQEAGADPGRLRIGMTTTAMTGVPVDPACEAAAHDAAELLRSLGHEVGEISLDALTEFDISSDFIKVVQTTTAYHPDVDPELIEPVNRALMDAAEATSSQTYIKALLSLQALTRAVVRFMSDLDLLLMPTLGMPPLPIGWMYEDEDPWMQLIRAGMFIPFTPLANITGLPAVSLPLYWNEDDLPIGVQLVGGPADEATLLRVSAQLEQARPWADRRPPVS